MCSCCINHAKQQQIDKALDVPLLSAGWRHSRFRLTFIVLLCAVRCVPQCVAWQHALNLIWSRFQALLHLRPAPKTIKDIELPAAIRA